MNFAKIVTILHFSDSLNSVCPTKPELALSLTLIHFIHDRMLPFIVVCSLPYTNFGPLFKCLNSFDHFDLIVLFLF